MVAAKHSQQLWLPSDHTGRDPQRVVFTRPIPLPITFLVNYSYSTVLSAFNDIICKVSIFKFCIQSKFIFWFPIRKLVSCKTSPLRLKGSHNSSIWEHEHYYHNLPKIIHVNGHDFPGSPYINHSHSTQTCHLDCFTICIHFTSDSIIVITIASMCLSLCSRSSQL